METSGKLAKYVVELGAYNIMFISRNAMKGQVLADFLSEVLEGTKEDLYFRMPEATVKTDEVERPSGIEHTYALRLTFPSTNNEAEYEALLAGLRITRQMNISNIE
nr:putative reverse transcriptase domain-containing protein [Tanacetum cinerariifolium]